ncbi:MAG: hypothetical protein IT318_15905 [Anaerolineales bacterium]|nr:hypothetical protein [Anaerolineales bacterium]
MRKRYRLALALASLGARGRLLGRGYIPGCATSALSLPSVRRQRSGRMSAVLYDHVATAADLFHGSKVDRRLLSGNYQPAAYSKP